MWAFEAVPHIMPKSEQINRQCIINNLYLESGLELLKIELVYNDNIGTHLEIHRASRTYDDSIILTLGDITSKKYRYGLGEGRLYKILAKYINSRKVLYSSNEVGSIFKDYLYRYKLDK